MIEILIGMISGIVSGTGMGGGTILIFLLTFMMGIEQHVSQATNLIFFIPTSIVAIIINIKNKNNYNKEDTHKKKNIPYRSDRYGDDFNWDSLYANYKEISATSNV